MKGESNQVIHFHVTSTVKISGATPVEKWVSCELKITIFNENGWDSKSNQIKYFIGLTHICFYHYN